MSDITYNVEGREVPAEHINAVIAWIDEERVSVWVRYYRVIETKLMYTGIGSPDERTASVLRQRAEGVLPSPLPGSTCDPILPFVATAFADVFANGLLGETKTDTAPRACDIEICSQADKAKFAARWLTQPDVHDVGCL